MTEGGCWNGSTGPGGLGELQAECDARPEWGPEARALAAAGLLRPGEAGAPRRFFFGGGNRRPPKCGGGRSTNAWSPQKWRVTAPVNGGMGAETCGPYPVGFILTPTPGKVEGPQVRRSKGEAKASGPCESFPLSCWFQRYDYSDEELSLLAAFDTDSFNRWEAMQRLGTKARR